MNNKIEIISGFKFAEIADIIFSGIFIKSKLGTLNLKDDITDNIGDSEYISVEKKFFELKENQIIFCKTEYIKELFKILDSQCEFKNIKLITHQSDLKISKKMYKLKPDCVSKWYSTNVDYEHSDLIPIPLGIGNFHSKNLYEHNVLNSSYQNMIFANKSGLLYINFNPNTNFEHRKNLYNYFEHENWVNSDKSTLNHKTYKDNLSKHNFTLTPWGNGIDTHRFWETLYNGSIPVAKKHLLYKSFKTFPKVLVNEYSVISSDFLNQELVNFQNQSDSFNFSELDFNHWRELICDEKENINNDFTYNLINHNQNYYRNVANLKYRVKSFLKVFNRYRRIIYRIFGL